MNTKTRNERDDFAQSHSSLRRIQSAVVRGLCGGIADMTLYRWLADPEKGFPKPIYIGRRRFWVEAEIFAWLEAQATKAPAKPAVALAAPKPKAQPTEATLALKPKAAPDGTSNATLAAK